MKQAVGVFAVRAGRLELVERPVRFGKPLAVCCGQPFQVFLYEGGGDLLNGRPANVALEHFRAVHLKGEKVVAGLDGVK